MSAACSFAASSQSVDWMPSSGRQWNLTKVLRPSLSSSRKLCTPKPSIMRSERGMVRSLIAHMIMCIDSGVSEMKSQSVSWALVACGKPRSGSGLKECTRSGNFIASWMKNTGMLLPTRS